MADMKSMLQEGVAVAKKAVAPDQAILELINRVFSTRNAIHFKHWASKSYAEHEALGYIYSAVVNKLDEIVEVYQGKNGILKGVKAGSASVPPDCCALIKEEAKWLGNNRETISNGNEAVAALLDELEATYLKTIYKLENLK